jgi:hypothetical protein
LPLTQAKLMAIAMVSTRNKDREYTYINFPIKRIYNLKFNMLIDTLNLRKKDILSGFIEEYIEKNKDTLDKIMNLP